jgi:hypothetical protein
MGSIFTIQQLLERHSEYNIETHLLCIEYVKGFDSVAQNIMRNNGRKRISYKFNETSPKYAPQYSHNYKER